MSVTSNKINKLRPQIIKAVNAKLRALSTTKKKRNYRVAWHSFERDVQKEIVKVLKPHFKNSKITIPLSKSVYPDILIVNSEGSFAIDIKCNESSKNPWFDMGRLDTVVNTRVKKFIEEWELVIKYETNTGRFLKAYFLLFREVVGLRKDCMGVSYRPYDGKLRPKSWNDFDNKIVHWQTKKSYLAGITKSLKFRWKQNITKHLFPYLTKREKTAYVKLFSK